MIATLEKLLKYGVLRDPFTFIVSNIDTLLLTKQPWDDIIRFKVVPIKKPSFQDVPKHFLSIMSSRLGPRLDFCKVLTYFIV